MLKEEINRWLSKKVGVAVLGMLLVSQPEVDLWAKVIIGAIAVAYILAQAFLDVSQTPTQ